MATESSGSSPTRQLFWLKGSICFLKGDNVTQNCSHFLCLPGVDAEIFPPCWVSGTPSFPAAIACLPPAKL